MSKFLQGILSARVLFAAFILVVGSLVVIPDSHACPPSDIEYTYYTDASKTVQCGWKYITCYCSVTSSGCVTSFYDITYWECPLSASSKDRPIGGNEGEAEGKSAVCKAP